LRAAVGGGGGGGGGSGVSPGVVGGVATGAAVNVGCVSAAVGGLGLTRKSSRNRIPPVVPGWEPEEQAERDRELREAGLAQAAVARAAWVFEPEPTKPPALASQGTGSTGAMSGGAGVGSEAPPPQPGAAPGLSSRENSYSSSSKRAIRECKNEGRPFSSARFFPRARAIVHHATTATALSRSSYVGGTYGLEGAIVVDSLVSINETPPSTTTTTPNKNKPSPNRLPSSVGEDSRPHNPVVGVEGGGEAPQAAGRPQQRAGAGGVPKPPLRVKVNQKELFLPNLVIEFGEDSPAFRRKVEALDSNVEGLRGQLQQLVGGARKYCGSGFAFCEHGRELAGVLMNPREQSWFTRLGALAPALESLGRVLEDIQVFQEETLLKPLEKNFYPMEEFVKTEVKTIRKVRSRCRYGRCC
ncbi:unnamed protein product, partial [Scytosiphon promiscuus]